MTRSGYCDDFDPGDNPVCLLWPSIVKRAIKGKRGQSFLRKLADAMDAMPEKVLIANDLVNEEGDCCTIGVFYKANDIPTDVDIDDPEEVGARVNISRAMAAEIEYMNDEWVGSHEKPEDRWERMRKWVTNQLGEPNG